MRRRSVEALGRVAEGRCYIALAYDREFDRIHRLADLEVQIGEVGDVRMTVDPHDKVEAGDYPVRVRDLVPQGPARFCLVGTTRGRG